MQSQLRAIKAELSKGKSSTKVSSAADELQFLMDFNSGITQTMAKTLEHLSDFVFVTVANTTLARRDSFITPQDWYQTRYLGCFKDSTSQHCYTFS